MRVMKGFLRAFLLGSRGFTLVEVLVVVGLFATVASLATSGVFQALSVQRSWRDGMVATREGRHAESWFARDALNAQATDLVDGAASVSSVTLTWTDGQSAAHTAAYTLNGGRLVRSFDGVQLTMSQRIVSAAFSRSGKVLTLRLEVQAEGGSNDVTALQTYLRALK